MTQETVTLIAAIIAAIVAIAAAIIAWKTSKDALRKASQTRLAEFRREWIEQLRLNICEYTAHRYSRHQQELLFEKAIDDGDLEATSFHRGKIIEIVEKQSKSFAYILLCLNDQEQEHRELEQVLQDTVNMRKAEVSEYFEKKGQKLTYYTRRILKLEWDRLKKELAE